MPKYRHSPFDRTRIRTAELIDRLTRCGLGQVEMTPSAVTAAVAVLKKALPDLTSVEVKDDRDDRVRIYAEVPRPIADLAEWMKGNPRNSTNVVENQAEPISPKPRQGILTLKAVEVEPNGSDS